MVYHPLCPNSSGEELAHGLCPTLQSPSPHGSSSRLCSPSPVPSLYCLCVFDLASPELWGSCSPSRAQPCATPGKGLVCHWQHSRPAPLPSLQRCMLGSRAASKRAEPEARGLPGPAGKTAGSKERTGCPSLVGGPDSPPSSRDLLHLAQPILHPSTSHPTPDSEAAWAQAALQEAASTLLRETP